MFRRRSTDEATEATTAVTDGSGKGRATPSRKDAEAARKARLKGTADPKAAKKLERERGRTDRMRARQALVDGDERYLPARDQGKAKSYARDFVDARRSAGEFMLPAVLVFLVLSFIPNNLVRGYSIIGFYLYMLLVLVDTSFLAWRTRRAVAQKYPDDTTKVGMYAALRALQLRRLRLPKPRVRSGAKV
ncbi:MAG TPA: DUF3043 domain-containing protein [Actinomycetes bacterium]